jgi:hypothetical protein
MEIQRIMGVELIDKVKNCEIIMNRILAKIFATT